MRLSTAILMPGARGKETPFVASLSSLLPQLRLFGAVNSLAQVVLKTAVPGIPDFYQGNELWELSLVDPDNRRPVDYDQRAGYLERCMSWRSEKARPQCAAMCSAISADGRVKLWTTHRALAVAATGTCAFSPWRIYRPLKLTGDHQENVIAFLRRDPRPGEAFWWCCRASPARSCAASWNCRSARLGATISFVFRLLWGRGLPMCSPENRSR